MDQAPLPSNEQIPNTTPVSGLMGMSEQGGQAPAAGPNTRANLVMLGVFAVLVVALILVYLWGSQLTAPAPQLPPAPQLVPSAATEDSSTDVTAIEADLEATNLDGMDAEMNQMEAELDAALSN